MGFFKIFKIRSDILLFNNYATKHILLVMLCSCGCLVPFYLNKCFMMCFRLTTGGKPIKHMLYTSLQYLKYSTYHLLGVSRTACMAHKVDVNPNVKTLPKHCAS